MNIISFFALVLILIGSFGNAIAVDMGNKVFGCLTLICYGIGCMIWIS